MTEQAPPEVSVHVAAAPEAVFPYFTQPARYVEWMGSEAVLEPVPGPQFPRAALVKAGLPRSSRWSPSSLNQEFQAPKESGEPVKPSGTRFVIR